MLGIAKNSRPELPPRDVSHRTHMAVKPPTPWPDVTGETGYFPPTIRCRLNVGDDTRASMLKNPNYGLSRPKIWTCRPSNASFSLPGVVAFVLRVAVASFGLLHPNAAGVQNR